MNIVFRVIANNQMGTGHVYRALVLANVFAQNHEVSFAALEEDTKLVQQIVGSRFHVLTVPSSIDIGYAKTIGADLLINDMLNTDAEMIQRIRDSGVRVVNFEDVGDGAVKSNLTINALFQIPQIRGGNILWGVDYYVLRDEFMTVQPQRFSQVVESVLVTYGGTDPSNLTQRTVEVIGPLCRDAGLNLYVVVGPGYAHHEQLETWIRQFNYNKLHHVRQTGYMAGLMSNADFAFTSNGRTVYELLHMNVPSVVIAHHKRENTHDFATWKTGFINLGVYELGFTEDYIGVEFDALLSRTAHRYTLFRNMMDYDLSSNRQRVVQKILEVME